MRDELLSTVSPPVSSLPVKSRATRWPSIFIIARLPLLLLMRRQPILTSPTLSIRRGQVFSETDDITHVFHACDVGNEAFDQAKAGMRYGAVASQVSVPPKCFLTPSSIRASRTSSRSSRWLPPIISPMPGARTSMAATVFSSSFSRIKRFDFSRVIGHYHRCLDVLLPGIARAPRPYRCPRPRETRIAYQTV